jgi:peptide/nickel transport system substrate-binding protein
LSPLGLRLATRPTLAFRRPPALRSARRKPLLREAIGSMTQVKERTHMRSSAWTIGVCLAATLSLAVAACGGGGSSSDKGTSQGKTGTPSSAAKPGGKLTVVSVGDVLHADCGQAYYQYDYFFCYATQRPLYSYKPTDGVHMVPDLASAPPQVSSDGLTVTVKIRSGVKFSPPVNREVTSKDVKYAIERMFFDTVQTGYATLYFNDIKGAKAGVKPGTKISGIATPDDRTVVFHLTKSTAGVLAGGALALPGTSPVPREWAAKFDKKTPTTYGENQVATGPYMVANNAQGKAIGWQPGKSLHLVRNPNWDKSTDYKPAFVDEIVALQGNDDTTVASRRILSGQSMVNGDWSPGPSTLKEASSNNKDQLVLVPAASIRYVAINTTVKPFDDVNVRKAVSAAMDRNALRLARGGPLTGYIATHYLAPGINGFDQAGGMQGPGADFLNTTGEPNMPLAAEYLKKAGYSSGKYTGGESVLMVGSNEGTAANVSEIVKANFEKLGFKVILRLVTTPVMYGKYCQSPPAQVAVCPNMAWGKDFADGQTLLDPLYNGNNILKQANNNVSQLNVPAINDAMEKATLVTAPSDRGNAWADIDKDIVQEAPAVPWLWDKQASIESANVRGVVSSFNTMWDPSWTSIKR